LLLWLPLALAAGGCIDPEPYSRPGTWQATGANEANLRAMVADPSHLDRGAQPRTMARGEAAAQAGARLGAAAEPAGAGGEAGGGGAATGGTARGIPALPPLSGQYVRR
jgi:hypothetical protein